MLPKDKKIQAFYNLKKPTNKQKDTELLRNASKSTELEPKHTHDYSNVEESKRMRGKGGMECRS